MESTDNTLNNPLSLAYDFVQFTNRNVFLTGKAGTGKTTFLHNLRRNSLKRMIVVAPTGVAAINAAGVTIHSFFQLGFGPRVPESLRKLQPVQDPSENAAVRAITRFSQEKINIIRSLDLLVIDEISMVRADLLDGIDEVLRRFRIHSKPFGGVQLLMIGDLHQLAPVAKEDEWTILKKYYDSVFFFSSHALRQTSYISIELKHIFRQSDAHFIDLLNNVRENKLDRDTLDALNARYKPDFRPQDEEGYITLTTHNAQAQSINEAKLKELPDNASVFSAKTTGDFPDYMIPTDRELLLKIGAQVMFVKNDPSPLKQFYNGKIGRISEIAEESVYVLCDGEETPLEVQPLEWENVKYSIDEETGEIKEQVIGSFVQMPLKLAWAITIHKSQGLTFDKAIIDAHSAFAFGQVYVALSRCRSLEGLVLTSLIQPRSIIQSSTVSSFTSNMADHLPDEQLLNDARFEFIQSLLNEIFDFSVLEKRILQCIRIRNEHRSALAGSVLDKLDPIADSTRLELLPVAEKFRNQLYLLLRNSSEVENNPALQDRIIKASQYFLGTMENMVSKPFGEISYETDNKSIRKSLSEQMDKIEAEIRGKTDALLACKDGFSLRTYLNARAKALVEPSVNPSHRPAPETGSKGTGKHPLLFVRLKEWRESTARNEGKTAHGLVPQRVLLRISEMLPCTFAELNAIKGFGRKKVKSYGKDILKLVLSYRAENKMEIPPDALEKADEPPAAKKPSRQETLELFNAGKSIDEIAVLHSFTIITIEKHLAHFVREGQLDPGKIVEREKLKKMVEYFLDQESLFLNPAREALGEKYSFRELRIASSFVEYLRKKSQGLLKSEVQT